MINYMLWSVIGTSALFMGIFQTPSALNEENFLDLRSTMVKKDIRGRGISDERVLSAMMKVKRHLFVPMTGKAMEK